MQPEDTCPKGTSACAHACATSREKACSLARCRRDVEFAGINVGLAGVAGRIDQKSGARRFDQIRERAESRVVHFAARRGGCRNAALAQGLQKGLANVSRCAEQDDHKIKLPRQRETDTPDIRSSAFARPGFRAAPAPMKPRRNAASSGQPTLIPWRFSMV